MENNIANLIVYYTGCVTISLMLLVCFWIIITQIVYVSLRYYSNRVADRLILTWNLKKVQAYMANKSFLCWKVKWVDKQEQVEE